MKADNKVVVRFLTGSMLKGYITESSFDRAVFELKQDMTDKLHTIALSDLKAIFFVRTFEGDPEYKESKSYGKRKSRGKRVFIKFRDGECMVGFLEGPVPWKRGFFLYRSERNSTGFYIVPADEGSNNIKTYVITDSVDDVTVVPCRA